MRRRKIDLTGKKFGRWTALKLSVESGKWWFCRCVCGERRNVRQYTLLSGSSASCGCSTREKLSLANTKHGFSQTREYHCWWNAKNRCYNQRNTHFRYYGGRGIRMCQRWQTSVENFIADMGVCPPGLTLERINNNGNYEPGNCKWATRKEQNANKEKGGNNRPDNVWLACGGLRMIQAEWARTLGVSVYIASKYISQLGYVRHMIGEQQ